MIDDQQYTQHDGRLYIYTQLWSVVTAFCLTMQDCFPPPPTHTTTDQEKSQDGLYYTTCGLSRASFLVRYVRTASLSPRSMKRSATSSNEAVVRA